MSHLPHLLSTAYLLGAGDRFCRYAAYAGPSFRDFTRVGGSPHGIWSDIFFTNRKYLLEEIDTFMDYIREFREALVDERKNTMADLLKQVQKMKDLMRKKD